MSVLESVLILLEETAADGLKAQAVLGEDIKEFCEALPKDYQIVFEEIQKYLFHQRL